MVEQDQCLNEARANPKQEVKEEESYVTQGVFHIIAENGEEEHVAQEMKPAPMEEARCNERHISSAGKQRGWNQSILPGKQGHILHIEKLIQEDIKVD